MTLTPQDLANIRQALEQALQRSGVTPSPPIDLPEQRRLGLRTLCQVARRAAAILVRVKEERDGKPCYPYVTASADLNNVVEEIEKEWRL